ncbi:MAG: toxin-antitoxin system YwqK family antitoxin, partial [Verrucomicrobiota bacterium]
MNRAAVVVGFLFLAVLGLVVGLRRWGSPASMAAMETVGRDRLILRDGRWMKTDETNAFTGLMVEFYPDGTLLSRSAVSNGVLHGVSEGWWTNAVLAVREVFVAGKSHGTRTKWNVMSHRIAETTISQGQIHGYHREWHTNGTLALEVTMSQGKPHGLSRKWSPDGSLAGQWTLSNGAVVAKVTNTVELQALAQKG